LINSRARHVATRQRSDRRRGDDGLYGKSADIRKLETHRAAHRAGFPGRRALSESCSGIVILGEQSGLSGRANITVVAYRA
jgi:hypothetical protein